MSPPPLAPQRTDLVIEWVRRCFHFLLFIVCVHLPESGRGSGNSCSPVQNSNLGFHGQTEDIQYNIQYSVTLLLSVNTLIARGMFCGAKYTHHTVTPILKHLITSTANKHPGKKSFIDKNMKIPLASSCAYHIKLPLPEDPLLDGFRLKGPPLKRIPGCQSLKQFQPIRSQRILHIQNKKSGCHVLLTS